MTVSTEAFQLVWKRRALDLPAYLATEENPAGHVPATFDVPGISIHADLSSTALLELLVELHSTRWQPTGFTFYDGAGFAVAGDVAGAATGTLTAAFQTGRPAAAAQKFSAGRTSPQVGSFRASKQVDGSTAECIITGEGRITTGAPTRDEIEDACNRVAVQFAHPDELLRLLSPNPDDWEPSSTAERVGFGIGFINTIGWNAFA